MGRDRSEGEATYPSGEDRPARGHAIGGAALGRCNDHSVAWIRVDILPIDVQFHVDHLHSCSDYDIVDCPARFARRSVPTHVGSESWTFVDDILSRQQMLQKIHPTGTLDHRQEPDFAKVDA